MTEHVTSLIKTRKANRGRTREIFSHKFLIELASDFAAQNLILISKKIWKLIQVCACTFLPTVTHKIFETNSGFHVK